MNPEAMKPFGLSLIDYQRGNHDAMLLVYRDDGFIDQIQVSSFFRRADEYDLDRIALDMCYGKILDAGAGSGLHSLFLQERGFQVCAIDVSIEAVQVMRDWGVVNVYQVDILSFNGREFNTILMMGGGLGMVEDTKGLSRLLKQAHEILAVGGQILLTSLDVRNTQEELHMTYQQRNIESGRYFGEQRIQFEYDSVRGPICGWMHMDFDTLKGYALQEDWRCHLVKQQDDGRYLAQLTG